MEGKIKMTLDMDRKKLIKIVFCFVAMIIIALLPPVEPMTRMGMRTLGVFVGTVLLLSLVDTTWPAILCMPLFAVAGVMTVSETVIAAFGSWITMFIIMSFVLTYALNETGFTSRLTAFYMSRKFVNKSPWIFTVALITLGMIVGWFLDPVPTVAFFLVFARRIFKELGYKPADRYPHMVTMALAFIINVAGGMTPISHSLAILGIGIYTQTAGGTINLFTYLMYGMPVGLIIYAGLLIILRLFFKPDMSNFNNFDVRKVLDDVKPMELREKITVTVFFVTVILWMLPGVLTMVNPDLSIVTIMNTLGPAFWAIIAVVLLFVIEIDKKPVIDPKAALKEGVNWNTVFLAAAAILLGGAITHEGVGLNDLIVNIITPITDNLPPMLIVLVITALTSVMTNFTSNVTTIVLMTGVGVTVALGSNGVINPAAIALNTTLTGALAYMVPASFASIGVLYGDEYSHGGTIFRYGFLMVIITSLVVTFIGYPLACAIL